MGKKLKVLIAGFLAVSYMMAFNMTGTNKAESLTPNKETKNISILSEPNAAGIQTAAEGYYKVAENNNLELYLNNSNLGLQIKNKATGYVWNSTLDTRDKNLNQTWQAFAQSAVTIEYMDEKSKIRQLSLTSENAKTNVVKKDSGFTADVYFQKQNIKLSLDVTLEDDSISIKVPYTSLEEKDNAYKIQSIILYPFLGAVKQNEKSGYMFVPDGSGALINFTEKSNATQPYVGRVYGQDLGVSGVTRREKGDNSLAPEQIYMPAFGVNHDNKNGFIASVESGAPYTEVDAYPAGVTTVFNWVTAKFIYRETYLQPIDKKGNAMTVNEKDKNKFDAVVRYMFLSNNDSSYVGMAKRYQKQLVAENILKKTHVQDDKDLPVRLEFLNADNKKQFLWKKVIPMTTVSQMDNILKDLNSNKVNNMTVVADGWSKGGVTGSYPNQFTFEKKVGSKADWMNFIKSYESLGIPVYMYSDFVGAHDGAKGYKKNDIAQTISEQLITFGGYLNYLNPNSTSKIFMNQFDKFNSSGMNNIALGTVGKNLMSAFNPKTALSRDASINVYEDMLSKGEDAKYALYSPNQYLLKYTNQYLDIPMDSSMFMTENESVPFMQIVLKGYVDYYAPASNFYSNRANETLKMIDYGALPSFYLTSEDPVKLLDTGSEWLYTSQYSVWKDEIIKTYETVNKALKDVKDAELRDRVKLQDGVIMNTYSNGVSVIINYTKEDYKNNEVSVPAENFTVIRRG